MLSTRFVTNKLRVSAIGNNRDGVANSVGRVYVGIHARAFVRAVSNGMQMSAGCIRSIAQRLRFPFFLRCEKEIRKEFECVEKSSSEIARCVRGSSRRVYVCT